MVLSVRERLDLALPVMRASSSSEPGVFSAMTRPPLLDLSERFCATLAHLMKSHRSCKSFRVDSGAEAPAGDGTGVSPDASRMILTLALAPKRA